MRTNDTTTQERIARLTTPASDRLPAWPVYNAAGRLTAETVRRLAEEA